MLHMQLNLYAIPSLLSAFVAGVIALYAWQRRQTQGAVSFALLMGAICLWALGEALFVMSTEPSIAHFWIKAEYPPMVSVPALWFIFAAKYAGKDKWLTRRNLVLLFLIPLTVVLLVWTNEFHGLYYATVSIDTSGQFTVLIRTPGPGYWFSVIYSYLMFFCGTLLFVYMFFRSPRPYRGQIGIMLVGALVPWGANVLHNSGLSPFPDLDVTPIAFTITGIVIAWGLFHFKLLDIVPIARDRIVENMRDGIVVLDAQMRIVDANPVAQRLIGEPLTQIIGQPISQIAPPDLGIGERSLGTTEAQTQIAFRRKDRTLHLDLLISPLYDRHKKLTGRLIVARDITKLRQTEEKLRLARDTAEEAKSAAEKAQRAAEAANQAKSTFLANMSHELRTPLNLILGFSELMMHDSTLTDDQQENLKTINRGGEHLLALINDVLELGKIEAGRIESQPESFDLHLLLLGLEEMFRLRAEQKGLLFTVELSPDVPHYVHADAHKLRQVLINILGNAFKFTNEGSVTLRVGFLEHSTKTHDQGMPIIGHSSLIFEIEDTGIGIAPEEFDALFAPFVQTASGQQAREGTGLGLSISREFVRMMGGEITIRSEPGRGSTFQFEVQAKAEEPLQIATTLQVRRVIGLEPGQPVYRLLIVDDVEASQKLLLKWLAPLGFDVRTASNGQEAIQIWETWQPHLIWMDLRMDIMDDHEATHRIKDTPQGGETIVVAVTASAFEQDRADVLAKGFDDFVRKPVRREEILDILTKRLGVQFLYAEPEEQKRTESKSALPQATTLAGLTADWTTALRQATIEANVEQVLSLIEQIREQDNALANDLAEMMRNYDYEAIREMLD